jgi:hypothetical protein
MEDMKLRSILASCILVLSISGCGYDGSYRYPCQDPANWKEAECKPPLCKVNTTCPEDVNKNITSADVDTTTAKVQTNG